MEIFDSEKVASICATSVAPINWDQFHVSTTRHYNHFYPIRKTHKHRYVSTICINDLKQKEIKRCGTPGIVLIHLYLSAVRKSSHSEKLGFLMKKSHLSEQKWNAENFSHGKRTFRIVPCDDAKMIEISIHPL